MGRRKKDKPQDKNYFGDLEEAAIIKFQNAETIEERNHIFTHQLYKPLKKLVHEIYNRFGTGTGKLVGKDALLEIQTMALTHVYEQIPKFNPNKPNKYGETPKAYSYLGTVCRHFVTNFGKKSYKEKLIHDNIDDYKMDIDENDNNKNKYIFETYEIDNVQNLDLHETLLNDIILEIKDFMDNKTDLTVNQVKVGEAIIMIFESWKNISTNNDVEKLSNFFTKKKIQQIIKDITNLESKEIKNSFDIFLSIYKEKYKELYTKLNDMDIFNILSEL